MKPGQFDIYKKSAAAQISLGLPKWGDKGFIERQGAVFIEAASATGEDKDGNVIYNWAEKITFSLGMNDLALLAEDFSKSLVHDWKGSIKTLVFIPGKDKYEGTYMLSLKEKGADGKERKVTVPVTIGESAILGTLFKTATARIIGWQ